MDLINKGLKLSLNCSGSFPSTTGLKDRPDE